MERADARGRAPETAIHRDTALTRLLYSDVQIYQGPFVHLYRFARQDMDIMDIKRSFGEQSAQFGNCARERAAYK